MKIKYFFKAYYSVVFKALLIECNVKGFSLFNALGQLGQLNKYNYFISKMCMVFSTIISQSKIKYNQYFLNYKKLVCKEWISISIFI